MSKGLFFLIFIGMLLSATLILCICLHTIGPMIGLGILAFFSMLLVDWDDFFQDFNKK